MIRNDEYSLKRILYLLFILSNQYDRDTFLITNYSYRHHLEFIFTKLKKGVGIVRMIDFFFICSTITLNVDRFSKFFFCSKG